jgi:DnaJ-class molecular chaperone
MSERCHECGGEGCFVQHYESGWEAERCEHCHGTGYEPPEAQG